MSDDTTPDELEEFEDTTEVQPMTLEMAHAVLKRLTNNETSE